MTPKALRDVISRLNNDTMFSSMTQAMCTDLNMTLGRPLALGLGHELPGPYQALLDAGNVESEPVSWLPVGEQLKLADAICVAFGMYDAHDRYKRAIQTSPVSGKAKQPWHQQVVEVLDNVIRTQRRTSNTDYYQTALKTLRDEAVDMPVTSEAVKDLKFQEFNQRRDSVADQWRDFLGLLAQAGLLDALRVIYDGDSA